MFGVVIHAGEVLVMAWVVVAAIRKLRDVRAIQHGEPALSRILG